MPSAPSTPSVFSCEWVGIGSGEKVGGYDKNWSNYALFVYFQAEFFCSSNQEHLF